MIKAQFQLKFSKLGYGSSVSYLIIGNNMILGAIWC